MKQKYEFYLTGEEEHQIMIGTIGIPFITDMVSVYVLYVFFSLLMVGRACDLTTEDTYMKVLLVLLAISTVPFIISTISLIMCRNLSPTFRNWNARQEYVIDGNKVVIHLTGAGVSQFDSFIVKKRKDKKCGTILYKSCFYYVVIPHRVKPVEVE